MDFNKYKKSKWYKEYLLTELIQGNPPSISDSAYMTIAGRFPDITSTGDDLPYEGSGISRNAAQRNEWDF